VKQENLRPRPSAGRIRSPPTTTPKGPPPIAAPTLLDRFAGLIDEPEPARTLRGMLLVIAEHVERHGRDCPQRTAAVDLLAEAADLGCEAVQQLSTLS